MNSMIKNFKSLLRKNGYDIIRHKGLPEWLHHHNVDLVVDIGANDGRYVEITEEIHDYDKADPIVVPVQQGRERRTTNLVMSEVREHACLRWIYSAPLL